MLRQGLPAGAELAPLGVCALATRIRIFAIEVGTTVGCLFVWARASHAYGPCYVKQRRFFPFRVGFGEGGSTSKPGVTLLRAATGSRRSRAPTSRGLRRQRTRAIP